MEDRASLGPRLGLTNMPSLVFFDTSSAEEDLNINQKLIETIVSEDSKSKLPAVGAEEIQVRVSSITDTGDLFVVKVRKAKSSHCSSSKGSYQMVAATIITIIIIIIIIIITTILFSSKIITILILMELPKVPDVAEQSCPPTQVQPPAQWSNIMMMITTMNMRRMIMLTMVIRMMNFVVLLVLLSCW